MNGELDIEDIIVGKNENGIPIVIPDDYDIKAINRFKQKDSGYVSFEEFIRELRVDEYRKRRGRHFIK